MNASISPTAPAAESDQTEQRAHKHSGDSERIRSSLARLTSTSIDGLQGLTTELQELQNFLKCEVERVQNDIEGALAGIKIIIETIAPWKNMTAAPPPPNGRAVGAGPAASIRSAVGSS